MRATGPKSWSTIFGVLLLVIGLLLLPSNASTKEQKGDVVVAIGAGTFNQKGGDPATQTGGTPFVAQTIFDSLIYEDLNRKQVPALAKSWKIEAGWKYIDFDLRGDVKFQDGTAFSAEDVKYSLETYLDRRNRYLFQRLWSRQINNVQVIDPHHVRVNMNTPDPGFLTRLWWGTGIFPKAYREKVGSEGFADRPIGAGPFKWVEYKQDVFWKAEAVKNHYRHTPEIKTLKMMYVPEQSTRLAMLQAGEVDIASVIGPQLAVIQADPSLRLVWAKYNMLMSLIFADLVFPNEPSPFHDIRVRKAVSLAIDRKTICEKILMGTAEPYGDFCSPITKGYDPGIKPDPYDPETAKKLLAEAGYAKGFETQVHIPPSEKYWVEALVANLSDVGINVKIDMMEIGAWLTAFTSKKMRGLTGKPLWFSAEPHPSADASDDFLDYMPWAYTTTPEIHQAVIDGQMAISEPDMVKAGRKISRLIRESRVRALLWAIHSPYGVGKKIKYWQPQVGAEPGTGFEFITLN